MPPASAIQGINPNADRGLGISSLLGTDYERKKLKLQQELQSDYKHYVTQKKDMKTNGPHPQPQGLSLPIDEKTSAKEKLREERKKEYNLFLQEKGQIGRLKRGAPPVTSKVQSSDAVHTSTPAPPPTALYTHTNTLPPYRERPASRRDAATLTEAVDGVKSPGTWDPSHRRQRRRWLIYRPTEPYSSEEEPITDKEEELEFGRRRRKGRNTPEADVKEERSRREHRDNSRAPQDIKEVEAPGVQDLNNYDWFWKSDTSPAARPIHPTSRDKAEFATGLLIGATGEEQAASQMRKEQYKQELLKQIAEEQRNKIREKKLELRVAATGATDPEKTPDRIKQFGAVNRQRGVPYALGMDDRPTETTEQRGPFNEDYHRDFYNMLGEVAVPRVAGAPPPIPPTVTDDYRTPYDDAYYYYGTRHPSDPDPPHYQNVLPGRVQPPGNLRSPPHKPAALRPGHHSEATEQQISMMSPLRVGELPVDKSKQKRESAISYQEALRQQIKEREERRTREKEEKEQYDAKFEAQMKAYNPWGRSGGGAPIKDQEGNLFSDLKQLRRISEESRRNPGFKSSERTVNGDSAGGEARAPVSHRLSALNDQPTPPQLNVQEKYKEALKQQIEEHKRKQADERVRQAMEEEVEEKRVSEERTRMQQRYQEEERKQTKIVLENQSRIREPATRRQEEDKKARQEQETEKKYPQSSRDREEETAPLTYEQREPSPPVPALQTKQTNPAASRPSSVVSQVSPRSERSVSAPHGRPVPVKTPQPQDGHHGVIRELSALRRYLRKEQEQLEVQMGRTDRQESLYIPPVRPRRRPRAEDFESARQEDEQPPTATSHSVAARVNMQNIRDFNQLKYRDSASREEVLHVYPDPPTDAQSLDIQQQALLREQQRKVRLMRREEDHDFLDQQLWRYLSRKKPGRLVRRNSMLPSENAFIDVYSGEDVPQRRPPQPSAERQGRTPPRRRHDCDISANQRERDIQPDARPVKSSSGEPEVGGHDQHSPGRRVSYTGEHDCKSERLSDDEVDVLSLRSALERRVSMETIATEAWLRPGTSAALRRSACRERPHSRMDAPQRLTHHIT
ncbi:centrosome and spindle pole-associated protein 1 isoform X2 [Scophthalmus maximus]|uniref:centrosome and spindle pole-associated protein 1 isoform X2 n=1 Tax=Scophthalmus maximus TaxID=52904 RepID=UPI001FA82EA9|nr:centrosome and spindle pole-associated protein 1 isoform X2 [Scophthalmus maximus]